ncbi:MAG: ATP-grasp domain-containing protein [Acidimicrobiales bacterium]
MRPVAIATAPGADDPDEAALVAALARHGLAGQARAWSDAAVPWDDYAQVVVRSTWDYTRQPDAFLAWTRACRAILNPPAALAYSADKRYLVDLAARGLPAVPTVVLEVGAALEWPGGDVVVKPAIGAGSRGAARFAARDAAGARAHAAALHARGAAAIVQPYRTSVDTHGEVALIYLGGRLSHAVRKDALLGHAEPERTPALRRAGIRAVPVDAAAREVADAVLRALGFADLAYARVDLLAHDATWEVLELELVEPMLYLGYAAGAADALAAAIAERTTP